jgi:hypothetical protein
MIMSMSSILYNVTTTTHSPSTNDKDRDSDKTRLEDQGLMADNRLAGRWEMKTLLVAWGKAVNKTLVADLGCVMEAI